MSGREACQNSAKAESNTYSPYEFPFRYNGTTATVTSPEVTHMCCGAQPDLMHAEFERSIADRNAYEWSGLAPPAHPSHVSMPMVWISSTSESSRLV